MTRTQWVILAMLGFAIVVVFCLTFWVITLNMFPRNTETTSPQPVAAQTVTVFIVATPIPIILKITIDDIEKCCAGMTTIQENQYLASLVGSHVNWRGTVDEIMLNGTVWVRVLPHESQCAGSRLRLPGNYQKDKASISVRSSRKRKTRG